MPKMEDEIVEKEDVYYKIGAKAIISAIFFALLTAAITIVLPLTSTGVFSAFGIVNFDPYNQQTILVIGIILTACSFFYNLFYNAKPLTAGVIGIIRYLFIFADTVAFFLLFSSFPIDLSEIGFPLVIVVNVFFLFPYWYGTTLLIIVGLNFIKSILQTAFWKELRIKKKAQQEK